MIIFSSFLGEIFRKLLLDSYLTLTLDAALGGCSEGKARLTQYVGDHDLMPNATGPLA